MLPAHYWTEMLQVGRGCANQADLSRRCSPVGLESHEAALAAAPMHHKV